MNNLKKLSVIAETEPCHSDADLWDDEPDDSGYPYRGAIIFFGIAFIIIFVGVIPWVYGAFKLLQIIF